MAWKPKKTTLPARFRTGFLEELDKRTDLYKTLRRRFEEIAVCAGEESPIKHSLIERYVFLEAVIRKYEAKASQEELTDKSVAQWIQANNSLLGLAKAIGLEPKQSSGAVLKDYISEKAN